MSVLSLGSGTWTLNGDNLEENLKINVEILGGEMNLQKAYCEYNGQRYDWIRKTTRFILDEEEAVFSLYLIDSELAHTLRTIRLKIWAIPNSFTIKQHDPDYMIYAFSAKLSVTDFRRDSDFQLTKPIEIKCVLQYDY